VKVLLAHPGTQYSPKLAAQLYRHGQLGAFHTGFVIVEGGKWDRAVSTLPTAWSRRLLNRRMANVPLSQVHLHPWDEAVAAARRKFGQPQQEVYHHRNAAFQERIPDSALSDATTVIGFDTSSWLLARRTAAQGRPFILDQSIGHSDSKARVFDELRRRYPQWSQDAETRLAHVRAAEQAEHELATCIVVPSTFAANTLVENGVARERIRVNPFGVDIRRFSPRPRAPRSPMRFCFVGSISVRKGVPLLLDAWKRLNLSDAELWLVGPASSAAATLTRGYRNVEYKGAIPNSELPETLRECDVFVFPSFFEGFAQVVPEAMACGLPVITTTSAGADIIEHGRNGWIVGPGDEEALIAAIENCLANPGALAEVGAAARQSVETLTWDHYGDRWARILAAVEAPGTPHETA
jgi:alpha-maltose-1-phosphate synthase